MRIHDRSDIEALLTAEATAAARSEGCDLVELKLAGSGRRQRLEVVVHKDGGVGIEDCARVSRALSSRLDAADALEESYVLEVSSPGLTRTLQTPHDYRLFRGRLARLELRAPIEGTSTLRGTIQELSQDEATIAIAEPSQGKTLAVPLALIASARLDFDSTSPAPPRGTRVQR